jgi:tetraacyldisaccharide 4'-kinase
MVRRKYFVFYPFSIIYRLITDIRNLLFEIGILHSEEFSIPVICVGNITVGGTGKTPQTEYLIDLLRKEFKVALLSRGYKRKSSGFRIATVSSKVIEIGDEPLQVLRKFPEITVAVDVDRRNGIKTILEQHPETDLIILDDGFQHRYVKPGLSILLTDYNRLITKDHLIPYGNLRESRNNRKRASIILVSKTPEETPESEMAEIKKELSPNEGQSLFFTSISYGNLVPLFETSLSKSYSIPEIKFKNFGVVLITGIAIPDPLLHFLEKYFKEIVHLNFPDHHYFSEYDIEKIKTTWTGLRSQEKIIITTEKDAVRLREFTNIEDSFKRAFYCMQAGVIFLSDEKYEFDNLISNYVRKNKRDNRFS